MPITVPGTAKNYQSPLKAIRSPFGNQPPEGQYQIPVEILWGTANMGGPNNLVSFNLQNSGDTKAITQICAVHVDNSGCGCDIEFIFTDTSETIVIPAYTPYACVPLFSRSLQFFVQAGINGQVVEATDLTRFTLFNFVPPPVVVPITEMQSTVGQAALVADGATTTQLVPNTVNGTISSIYLYRASPAAGLAGPGSQTWTLTDGNGQIFSTGTFSGGNLSSWNVALVEMMNLNFRFSNGLKFTQTGNALGGTYSLVVGYRTP